MTARVPAVEPTFAHQAERLVWETWRDQLPGDAILVSGLRIVDKTLDHEADIIVLLPNASVAVIEVKGGSVWYGARDRDVPTDEPSWWQQGDGQRRIDPVHQAMRVKYAVRDYVESDPRWNRQRVTWAHAVVTPYSAFPDDFAAPDCPRWALQDRNDLATLGQRIGQRIGENARRASQGKRAPTHDDIELISEILKGRGFTGCDRNAEAAQRQSQADRLTSEQAMLLRVTRLPRVEVRGGAGSVKTVLALAQARELTRGRPERPAQRIALLCSSIGLAEYLKRSFWEHELPARMAELAAELPPGHRFDSFIVDEAQDFADNWWTPLLRAMKDEETGGLYVYSDENQRIFARFGQPPVPLAPLALDHNLRNTRQIHSAFGPLAPTRMTSRGGEGAEVHFIPASADKAVDVADDAVSLLLDIGWFPGNVALLTTGHRPPSLRPGRGDRPVGPPRLLAQLLGRGRGLLWPRPRLQGPRTTRRRALPQRGHPSGARQGEAVRRHVRATDHLIVVGEPEVIREYAGDVVAQRLGIQR